MQKEKHPQVNLWFSQFLKKISNFYVVLKGKMGHTFEIIEK